ncbi:Phosphate metabolism transcription protein [Kalmusia sp. IMI 367209]|nr:Phosphate metabolism transcription protein [Kalmusia sp. IMI 367209]
MGGDNVRRRPLRFGADTERAVEMGTASNTPIRQRAVKVSSVVQVICAHAFEVGLDQDALRTVVQIASVKTELDQTSVTTLVKNLYPAQRVPADVVVTIVGALGQGKGKPTPGTQNGFVKWLATVHEIIQDPNVLSRLYGVLFGMLDSISIRLELARGLGNEPALQGLLRIYKDYYPDIILGSTTRPDTEWRSRILAVQERAAAENESGVEQHSGFKVLRKGPKGVKTSAIPDVHTFHTNEASNPDFRTSVTLEGIDNVEDFVEKLDRIEPPGQLVSFLTDPLLQKYVELKDSPIISRRIQLWLSTCLEEQYYAIKEGTVDERYLSEILEGLLEHAQYTKKLLPIVQSFLKEYLLIWDGLHNVDTVFGLLSYIPIQPFADAYATFLQPAERALLTHTVEACECLLRFYTSLLRQWANQASPQPSRSSHALAHPDQRALHDLAAHVATFCESLILSLQSDSTSAPAITSSILTFYEHLSASSKPHQIPIILLPTPLLYLLTLSPSATTLTRTAGIVANYKHAFDDYPKRLADYYSKEMVENFNCAIRDIHNLLWSSKALSISKETKALGLYCELSLRDTLHAYVNEIDHGYNIQSTFNLSHNPLLASSSLAVWLDVENKQIEEHEYDSEAIRRHEGPVSHGSLEKLRASRGVDVHWEAYRVAVLIWLAERGLPGLRDFMFAASTGLKAKYRGRV